MGPLNSAFEPSSLPDAVSPALLPSQEFSRLIEQVSVSIPDPLLKLRFIQAALDRYQQTCRLMGVAQLNRILCKQILVELADRLLPGCKIHLSHPALEMVPDPPDPPARRTRTLRFPWLVLLGVLGEQALMEMLDYILPGRGFYRGYRPPAAGADRSAPRLRVLSAPVVAMLLALMGLTYAVNRLPARPTGRAASNSPPPPSRFIPPAKAVASSASAATTVPVPTPTARAAAPPEIWLVEKKPGYEFYSNGLRVSTEYEVSGEPRRYQTLARADGALSDPKHAPVGLLYHTSEGDVPPFQSAFNRSLTQHTRGLLQYVKQDRLYHYLIDRFGRTYRIVPDDAVAYHAGFSVWSDESDIFILLNQSFIGICFEGRWAEPQGSAPPPGGGGASPPRVITRAQVDAGRQLTDMLRWRHRISDRNCVTHGLTSVNPQKYLIGFHLDWATDFPFRELGLTDKYQLPSPSIVEFGFAYDDFFLQVMGKPWPGVDRALEQLRAQAARERVPYETLKRRLNRQFENQLARVRGKPLFAKEVRRAAWPDAEGQPQGVVLPWSGQP